MDKKILKSILDVDKTQWDALWNCQYPFIRYDFLKALEVTGCTTAKTGWQPHHLALFDGKTLVAAMPLYLKTHSYGEYVFDWAWADAYHNAGLNYYPKLVCAIPFTPATGPRLAASNSQQKQTLLHFAQEQLFSLEASSLHWLFPEATRENPFETPSTQTIQQRLGCQFHWHNNNYTSFDDFLQNLTSRKRKNISKERKKVNEQGIRSEIKTGNELTEGDWKTFYNLYKTTYLKKSGHAGYLSEDFFITIGKTMPNNVMIVDATLNNTTIAQALYFYDDTTLYGRYWGAHQTFDALHYECCYYQGIEFCIRNNLRRFDAGAQGEHKIARGFTPLLTQSYHLVAHPEFAKAIAYYLQQERNDMQHYCKSARELSPYKEAYPTPPADALLKKQQ